MEVVAGHFCISHSALPVFKTHSSQKKNPKNFCLITTTIDVTPTYLSLCSRRFCLCFLHSERGIDGEPAKESSEGKEPAGTATITQGGWGWTLYTAGHGASGLRHRASWPGSEAQLNPKLWFLALAPITRQEILLLCLMCGTSLNLAGGEKKSAWTVKIRTRETVPGCNKIDERENTWRWIGLWLASSSARALFWLTSMKIITEMTDQPSPPPTQTVSLPASWPASSTHTTSCPTRGSTLVPLCTDRLGQIGTIPPSISTHSSTPLRAPAASAQGANSTFKSPFVLIMLT